MKKKVVNKLQTTNHVILLVTVISTKGIVPLLFFPSTTFVEYNADILIWNFALNDPKGIGSTKIQHAILYSLHDENMSENMSPKFPNHWNWSRVVGWGGVFNWVLVFTLWIICPIYWLNHLTWYPHPIWLVHSPADPSKMLTRSQRL